MRPHRTALALLLSLAVAACSEAPTGTVSAEGVEPRLAVVPACVEFGPPPPLGALYGGPVGTIPLNTIFVENGVRVYTNRFFFPPPGGTAYNLMRIENAFGGFGFGQIARANNINIGFDYSAVGFVVKTVKFHGKDLGGVENLIVNNSNPFIGELDTPPPAIAGVAVSSLWAAIPGGDQGITTLTAAPAPIKSFEVGGQEFWVDRVCAWP